MPYQVWRVPPTGMRHVRDPQGILTSAYPQHPRLNSPLRTNSAAAITVPDLGTGPRTHFEADVPERAPPPCRAGRGGQRGHVRGAAG
jgi:hypothetical protein